MDAETTVQPPLPPPPPPPPPPPSSSVLCHVVEFDTALSLRLYTLTHSILPYTLLKSLEISGDGRLFFPLILSLLLYLLSTTTTSAASTASPFLVNLLLGALLDLLLIGLLKHLIRRPRPVYNKNMFLTFSVDHWSFPSGHSSRVSFIATLFYIHSNWVRSFLITLEFRSQFLVDYFVLIVATWAVITSISRILLGRHFVFDVLVGMCLGVLEGLFVFRVFSFENLILFFR